MDPSFRIRGHESEVTVFSTQDWVETKKRGTRQARGSRSWDDTFLKAKTWKQKDHRQK